MNLIKKIRKEIAGKFDDYINEKLNDRIDTLEKNMTLWCSKESKKYDEQKSCFNEKIETHNLIVEGYLKGFNKILESDFTSKKKKNKKNKKK